MEEMEKLISNKLKYLSLVEEELQERLNKCELIRR